jgi:hypothetical protein
LAPDQEPEIREDKVKEAVEEYLLSPTGAFGTCEPAFAGETEGSLTSLLRERENEAAANDPESTDASPDSRRMES